MISFPLSKIKQFVKQDNNLQYEQEFYVFMALKKVTNPTNMIFYNQLYKTDNELTKTMIASVTDPNQ